MTGFFRQRFSAHRYLLLPGVIHLIRGTCTAYKVNYIAINSLTECFKIFFSYAFTHEGDKNSFIRRCR